MIAPRRIPTPGEIADVAAGRGRAARLAWAWGGLSRLWLPMAGCQGARLIDFCGVHDAALTNMVPASDWVQSPWGWALDLDGTNDYIDCGVVGEMVGSAAITLWALVRFKALGTYDAILVQGTNADRGIGLWTRSSGAVIMEVESNWYEGPAVYDTGVWYNIMATYRGSRYCRIFVDGVLKGEDASGLPATMSTSQTCAIGRQGGSSAYYAFLQVAAAGVWADRAFSAREAQAFGRDPYGLVTARRGVSTFSSPAGGSAMPALTRYYRNRRCA
jgi:hypothetical protein